MLKKLQDAIRIQQALANKGIKVTPLEAYDSWIRYSLSHAEDWIEIRKNDKDETIYRKVRRHILQVDEPAELLKVKDKVEEKFTLAVKDLDTLSKTEFQKLLKYRSLLSSIGSFIKGPVNIKS